MGQGWKGGLVEAVQILVHKNRIEGKEEGQGVLHAQKASDSHQQ